MAHLEDDSEFDYLPSSDGCGFLAAGWISRDCNYRQDAVSDGFFRALCRLLANPWTPPVASAGVHRCELCRFSGGSSSYRFEEYSFSAIGSSELFVPTESGVYVAPISIAHYIDAHGYCPSEAFQEAVLTCPEMRSTAYLKLLLNGGVREWTRRMEERFGEAEQVASSKTDSRLGDS